MNVKRFALSSFVFSTLLCSLAVQAEIPPLEKIMSHPDWIGNAPENPYISTDNTYVYYQQKREGSDIRDLWRVELTSGATMKIEAKDALTVESVARVYSPSRSVVAWTSMGDAFVQKQGRVMRLSQTGNSGQLLGFIGEEQLVFRQENAVVSITIDSGFTKILAHFKSEEAPDASASKEYLTAQQTRLFDIIKKRAERKTTQDAHSSELIREGVVSPKPVYLGKGKTLSSLSVSPDGQFILFGVAEDKPEGRADKMPHYVAEDGYVKIEEVRSKVGTDKPTNESLKLLTVATQQVADIALDFLPGISSDPLHELKKQLAKKENRKLEKSGGPRPVYIPKWPVVGIKWSKNGESVALNIFSSDNKDRWLVRVDMKDAKPSLLHHLHDPAWVNDYEFNEFDWLKDGAFWYTSEESGYSHLYLKPVKGKIRQLTKGAYEVNRVQPNFDGQWLYFRANKSHPGNHEVFRVRTDNGVMEAVTQLGGDNEFVLAPQSDDVVVTHSTTTTPPELFLQSAKGESRQLTHTVSEAFQQFSWMKPEIVAVRSRHTKQPIYARVYRNDKTQSGEPKPAVMFVHGAGYLQNAHMGWSGYFREYMFHNLLVEQGFVVIDMDYRASEGYGRDWRTAIYRQMGTPELEDYLEGVEWLVKEANVDRQRIGIYGGSYGGFMAFMGLFKAPDVFAAGAALRPVTDWAHYNHEYTSNILNTPDVDPEAYARSSPIEFAANLKNPLLICTGMLDDNVFFQDSVRLVQRLIELKKQDFELAVYPIEPHGFREPESWLDEYRRINKLMLREVKGRKTQPATP